MEKYCVSYFKYLKDYDFQVILDIKSQIETKIRIIKMET